MFQFAFYDRLVGFSVCCWVFVEVFSIWYVFGSVFCRRLKDLDTVFFGALIFLFRLGLWKVKIEPVVMLCFSFLIRKALFFVTVIVL